MIKSVQTILVIFVALTASTVALALPDYYDEDKFEDVGRIDFIDLDNNTVVIGDIAYGLSDSVTVNSLSSAKDSMRRLRQGSYIAFRTSNGQLVVEIWLLPDNYKPSWLR